MPVDTFYQLQFADPNSDYWQTHNNRSKLKDARAERDEIMRDERARGTGRRCRIVKYEGKIHDRPLA